MTAKIKLTPPYLPARHKMTAAMLAMAMLLLACNTLNQVPPTVVINVPTRAPTQPATATAPPVVEPTPTTEPAIEPTADDSGSGGGGVDNVVLLTDLQTNPPTITVADPFTGKTQSTFEAPGMGLYSLPRVGGPFVFYLNPDTQVINRVGFDGAVTELPFINSGGPSFEGDYLPSPDGTMIAWGTSTFDTSTGADTHITLNVAWADGSDQQVLVDEYLSDSSPLPQPIQWSADGRYFYYTNIPYGIGGYILFGGGPDLHRVDVETGEIIEILPDTGCLCPMRVSPDGKTVAYIPGAGTLDFVLHAIESGEERKAEIDPGHLQAGHILWSPDGRTLIYTMAISNFENTEAEQYAIVRVDAATLEQTVIVRNNEALYDAVLWPVADVVWVMDKGGNAWLMNPETGELTVAQEGKQVVR
jgi:WD40-like Beta Propeller Repeat